MAHREKYKGAAVGHLIDHYERGEGCRNSERDNIDWSRTEQNYCYFYEAGLKRSGDSQDASKRLRERIEEVKSSQLMKTGKKVRKDAILMSDWVVTLPRDYEGDPKKFFDTVNVFMTKRYGRENVFGFVHMDENTPHCHFAVVPELEGSFNAKKVHSRYDLRTFHSELQDYVDEKLDCHVSILLDEDDVLGKAKSKLTRSELNALNEEIRRSVASETAQERQRLQEWEKDLTSREKRYERLLALGKVEDERLAAEASREHVKKDIDTEYRVPVAEIDHSY